MAAALRAAWHRALGHNVLEFPPEPATPNGGWYCCLCEKDWPRA